LDNLAFLGRYTHCLLVNKKILGKEKMSWFINDRGMMFGNRINLIDLFVIVFLMGLLPIFWFGYKVKKNLITPPMPPKTTIEIQISRYEQLKEQTKEIERITIEKNRIEEQITNYLKEFKNARKYFPK